MSDEGPLPQMSEDEIMADLQTFEQEPVEDKSASLANKDLPAQSSSTATPHEQATTGEAPPEEDAGKGAEGGAEPQKEEQRAETWTDAQGRVHDTKTGQILSKEKVAELEAAKAAEPEPKTNYEKAKKEQERQKSVLSGFEEEKKRVRAEQDARERAIAERERQLELKAREQIQQNGQRRLDANGQPIYSSKEYWDAYLEYRDKAFKGEEDPTGVGFDILAQRAWQAAQEAQGREAKEAEDLFRAKQTEAALQVFNAPGNEDLRDPNSPRAKRVQEVFAGELERARKYGRRSIFETVDGFENALYVANLEDKAAAADDWKAKYEAEHKEVERLNGLTQVESSSPTQERVSKRLEDMTADEAEAELDREFVAAGGKLIPR